MSYAAANVLILLLCPHIVLIACSSPFPAQVTIEVKDKEADEYSPVGNGNGILLRAYTYGMDGGEQAPGLVEASGVWTLTFANMDLNLDGSATTDDIISALSTTNYPAADYSMFRLSVSIIGIDNVENSAVVYTEVNPLT